MGKNNNKGDNKPKNTSGDNKGKTPETTQKPPVNKQGSDATTSKQQPPKVTKPTPKPDATAKVENVNVEEVETLQQKLLKPFTAKSIQEMEFNNFNRMSADGQAILLSAAQRFFEKQDPASSLTMFANDMLSLNFCYALVRVSVQNWQEGRASGLNVPTNSVERYVTAFNSFGLALEPAKTSADGTQTQLEFKEEGSDAEVIEQIKEDNKLAEDIANARVVVETDPEKWNDHEEACKGLCAIMSTPRESGGNNFHKVLLCGKKYLIRIADVEQTRKYGEYTLGDWFQEILTITGKKSIVFSRGLVATTTSSMKAYHNVVFAHCHIRESMPEVNDEEARDLIKSFIVVNNKTMSHEIPIDEDLAVKNGITGVTRDFLLKAATELDDSGKRLMGKLKKVYKDSLGHPEKDEYVRNAVNKMIEITNLYLEKEAGLTPYEEKEYPEAYKAAVDELAADESPAKETPAKEEKPAETPAAEVKTEDKADPKPEETKAKEKAENKKKK